MSNWDINNKLLHLLTILDIRYDREIEELIEKKIPNNLK